MLDILYKDILNRLKEILGDENVKGHEPMSLHTTFRAGGEALIFLQVQTESQLVDTLKLIRDNGLDYYLLGNGSNVLVRDEGYEGVILTLSGDFVEIPDVREIKAGEKLTEKDAALDTDVIMYTVKGGYMLGKASKEASSKGYSGMETLAGIPGTIGGAVAMNAGAYGGEIKDIIYSARVMDKDGNIRTLKSGELALEYRNSLVLREGLIVLEATFLLKKGNKQEIDAKLKQCQDARREKQPLEYPSAGSTFKRPEGYFAGKLIMDAGLRGYQVGGARVSDKHCGFVINADNATATDILSLMKNVIDIVEEKFGVVLEPEVRVIGKNGEKS